MNVLHAVLMLLSSTFHLVFNINLPLLLLLLLPLSFSPQNKIHKFSYTHSHNYMKCNFSGAEVKFPSSSWYSIYCLYITSLANVINFMQEPCTHIYPRKIPFHIISTFPCHFNTSTVKCCFFLLHKSYQCYRIYNCAELGIRRQI
jgi:hypothetical protein